MEDICSAAIGGTVLRFLIRLFTTSLASFYIRAKASVTEGIELELTDVKEQLLLLKEQRKKVGLGFGSFTFSS